MHCAILNLSVCSKRALNYACTCSVSPYTSSHTSADLYTLCQFSCPCTCLFTCQCVFTYKHAYTQVSFQYTHVYAHLPTHVYTYMLHHTAGQSESEEFSRDTHLSETRTECAVSSGLAAYAEVVADGKRAWPGFWPSLRTCLSAV